MSRPKQCTDLTPSQKEKFALLQTRDDLKEHEKKTLDILIAKKERFYDPPLSEAAKKYLITRYSWEKYNRGTLSVGDKQSTLVKGNELEGDAIKMLSKRDRTKYIRGNEFVSNDFIFGRCDIYSPEINKVVLT